jgi:hypothetical protein
MVVVTGAEVYIEAAGWYMEAPGVAYIDVMAGAFAYVGDAYIDVIAGAATIEVMVCIDADILGR